MKVLVTGGAGYVGSVVVAALLERGHQVRVVDLLKRGADGLLGCCRSRDFSFVHGDISDITVASRAVEDVDAIVHLAALVGYPACLREPGLARLTNVAATQTLIDVRQPGQKLVFASTGSIYGKMPDAICTEETEPSPVSLYGETKAESERIVLKAGDSVSLRFATAYGVSPCMRDDLLINNFTREAVHNRALVVYESHARRTFVHVRDMASSMIFALDAWDSVRDNVFNVGDQALSLTKGEICQRLMSYVDYHVEFADIAEDLDCRDYTVSFEAFRRKGYQTEVDFDDAIRELVMAYRLRAHA